MVTAIALLLLVGAGAYAAVLLVGTHRLLARAPHPRTAGADHVPACEIIVVARDEEESLPALHAALAGQEEPTARAALCLVDDGSADGTSRAMQRFRQLNWPVRILRLDPPRGKKEALLAALRSSQADLALILDADCRPEPSWLRTLLSALGDPRVVAAQGPVCYRFDSPISRILALEFLGLQMGAWLSAALGRPLSATAANFAFRRVPDPQAALLRTDLASGDDFFLVRRLRRRGVFHVTLDPGALVWTDPPKSLLAFASQRIRWASKLPSAGAADLVVLGGLYFLHVAILLTPWLWLAGTGPAALFASLCKIAADFWVCARLLHRLRLRSLLPAFPIAELLLHLEVALSPIAFLLPFRWKGERYRPRGRRGPAEGADPR